MGICQICDGPTVLLGILGRTAHSRCRDCGYTQVSTEAYDRLQADVEEELGCEPGELENLL